MAEPAATEKISQEALKQAGEKKTTPRGKLVAERMRQLQKEGARAVLESASSRESGVSDKRKAEFLLQMDAPRRAGAKHNIEAHSSILQGKYESLPDATKEAWHKHVQHGLESSKMGGLFAGPPPATPEQMKQRTEALFNDPQFMESYQQTMDNIVNSRPDFSGVSDRADFLMADDPGKYKNKKAAEADARSQILSEWRSDQERQLLTVMSTSVDAYIDTKAKQAQQASSEGTNLVVNAKIAEHEKLWHEPGKVGKELVKQEFAEFMKGGGEAVLGKETWDQMSEEDRAEFNKRYGEKMFTERLLAGKLGVDDMRTLGTAEWLGEDFPARVEKIREMFEANNEFKQLIAEGQANGTIDKNMWDKIKAAGPAGLAGAILAILGVLFMPAAAVIPAIGYGVVAAGGAAVAGGAKMGIDEMSAA